MVRPKKSLSVRVNGSLGIQLFKDGVYVGSFGLKELYVLLDLKRSKNKGVQNIK